MYISLAMAAVDLEEDGIWACPIPPVARKAIQTSDLAAERIQTLTKHMLKAKAVSMGPKTAKLKLGAIAIRLSSIWRF